MLHGRIGTLALGGLAAYLLINKAMNMVGHTVDKVCDASKWRSYYRNSKGGAYVVAPGYSSYTRPVGNDQEWVVEKNPERKPEPKKDASETSLGASIAEGILKVIKDKLDGVKAPEEGTEPSYEGEVETKSPHEGEETASESDICVDPDEEPSSGRYKWEKDSDKPHDYAAFMTYIHDCEEKGMGEKEIALSLGMDVSTLRSNICNAENILHEMESEPLYTDDLYNGVEVVEEQEGEPDEDLD